MSQDSSAKKESKNTEAILETRNLTKRFGGLTAVDGVSYQMPRGDLRCIIGPNGAGKSTFLKLLVGRLRPDVGQIFYNGEDITDLEPYERARRGISLKFQKVSVYPNLSVRENLRIPVQRYTRGNREHRVEEILNLTNLAEQENVLVDNLSHGEQQWLEIGMAMAIGPDLLLLDEPTAGMTIEETRQTGELVQSLVEQGVSAIVIEHDINFVRQIADWVTVLHKGQVFAEGTVVDVETNEGVQEIYLGKEE